MTRLDEHDLESIEEVGEFRDGLGSLIIYSALCSRNDDGRRYSRRRQPTNSP